MFPDSLLVLWEAFLAKWISQKCDRESRARIFEFANTKNLPRCVKNNLSWVCNKDNLSSKYNNINLSGKKKHVQKKQVEKKASGESDKSR